MSQTRSGKFERMLRYQSNRVDMLRQQLAVQNSTIANLNQELGIMSAALERIQTENCHLTLSLDMHEQCGRAMLEAQKKIKTKKMDLATALEKFDFLLEAYREEDKRLQAWQKLVERETLRERAEILSLEIQQADELNLLTKLSGDHR